MLADGQTPPGDHLETLLEASRALLQSFSLEETLSAIVRLSQQTVSADAYAVWFLDRDEKQVRLITSSGLSPEYIQQPTISVSEDEMEFDEMIIPDVHAEPLLERVVDRYKSEGIWSLLVLPLKEGDTSFGTLTLYYKTPHGFDERELTLARTLANLSAAAITSARLMEEQAESKRLLEATLASERRTEARLRFLNRASEILNESLDYRTTLSNMTRSVVPEFADWCTVSLLEDGDVKQVALAHADPARVRWAEELRERYPPDPDAPQGIHHIIRTGQSEIFPEIPQELLAAAAQDEEHLRLIQSVGLKSYIGVPIRTRTEVIGALALIQAESGRVYDERDLAVAEQVGWRAGLAVEKARLYEASELGRAELERSNRAKDEFLGIVSHELRTPISTIYGSARLLRSSAHLLAQSDRDELIEGIEQESSKMVQLVESLLMLARLEVGQGLNRSTVDVTELIEKCLEDVRESGRSVATSIEARMRTLEADPIYIEHALTNLLTNANKYSPPEESIEVRVTDEGKGLAFRVLDRGPGVDASELELIFDSFYRAGHTSHLPGKGLGLSICKRLIEAQEGRVWASLRQGGGLEVGFWLPLRVEASS